MNGKFPLFILWLLLCGCLFAVAADSIIEADGLHDIFNFAGEKKLLLTALNEARTAHEKADVYWRLARVTLLLGDDAEDAGAKPDVLLRFYEEGEQYADKAIDLAPANHLAYYWKSSNMGRWGQIKGVLDSLGRAEPMQKLLVKAIGITPEHSDSYFVLGELYDELPGWPVSFGNIDFAVSFARKSIALNEKLAALGVEKKNYAYSIKLAKHLFKRNWDANKRKGDQKIKGGAYASKSSALDKGSYFEGSLSLLDVSDRAEAKIVINGVIQELYGIVPRNKIQNDDLKTAQDLLKSW